MSTPTIEPTQPGAVIDPDTDHLHFEMAETAPIASSEPAAEPKLEPVPAIIDDEDRRGKLTKPSAIVKVELVKKPVKPVKK
ncbi:hypothetical protein FOMPIDRAFT_84540 [Fomitopsis schrenkii]|uniref:Uncharacterized protein n=1 Tax=Fomitopsis schrenkii TaxID=2126942 RepID=S8FT10_FOMSC|nr:hypothetical protein FOMPIDRAFT_84540 [Fomitopsis schrenkii]